MKTLILSLVLLLSVSTFAQKSEVITTDSTLTKAKLFSQSVLWVTTTWKSANNVIQMKDENEGIIVVKGFLSAVPTGSFHVKCDGNTASTITIRVKDGKAKIEFAETAFKWSTGMLWPYDTRPSLNAFSKKQYERWLTDVDGEQLAMINSFKKALNTKDDF